MDMIETKEIELNEAKKRFEEASRTLEKAIKWYKSAGEDEKQKVSVSEDEISKMSLFLIMNEANNIAEGGNLYKNNTQEQKENSEQIHNIPDFLSLYFEVKESLYHLKECQFNLNQNDDMQISDSEKFLEYQMTGNVVYRETYDTSILDNYRNWGIERICLDGFQNHLPEDSKGSKCFLQFLIDDKWVDYEEAILQKEKISKVRFADDGVGFSSMNLKFLSSQKTSEDLSAGQFGEGLKLISMASVNLGLGIEIQSQNWVAKAYGKPVKIMNHRKGEPFEEQRNQLAWDVSIFDAEPIKRLKNSV